jgi:hypothetical protein
VVVVWKKYTCIVVANKAALGGKNTRREKEWLFCVANSVFGLYDGCFADSSVFLGDYTSIRIFLQDRVLLDGDVGYIEQHLHHLHRTETLRLVVTTAQIRTFECVFQNQK